MEENVEKGEVDVKGRKPKYKIDEEGGKANKVCGKTKSSEKTSRNNRTLLPTLAGYR